MVVDGIQRQFTASYTSDQNDVVKKKSGTVVELTRIMLTAKYLPNSFWAEAVATVVFLLNISPIKAVWNQTPHEAWCGMKLNVSGLKVFGCICLC